MMKLNETFLRQVAKYCVSRLDKRGGQLEWWAKCGSPIPDYVTAQVAWEWPSVHGMAKGYKPEDWRAVRNCAVPKWFSLLSGTSSSLLGQPMAWHCVDNSRLAGDMPSSQHVILFWKRWSSPFKNSWHREIKKVLWLYWSPFLWVTLRFMGL